MLGLVFARVPSLLPQLVVLFWKKGACEVASGVRGKVSAESDEVRDEDALGVEVEEDDDES